MANRQRGVSGAPDVVRGPGNRRSRRSRDDGRGVRVLLLGYSDLSVGRPPKPREPLRLAALVVLERVVPPRRAWIECDKRSSTLLPEGLGQGIYGENAVVSGRLVAG